MTAAGFLLARKLCLGVWVGQYPGGLSPAAPLEIFPGIPRFVFFMLFPAPYPGTQGVPTPLLIAAGVSACLVSLLLLSNRERRLTLWAGAVTIVLAFPVLAIVGTLQRPEESGRIFLLPTIGFALVVGHLFRDLSGVTKRLPLVALFLAWATLLTYYHQPRIETAGMTRRVLRQIEAAAASPGVSRVVIVGLPEHLFGARNFALPRAAGRPFITIPPSVTVELASQQPQVTGGSTRVLVWNTGRGALEVEGIRQDES